MVDFDTHFEVEFVDKFVGDVLLGRAVVEQLDKVFFVLHSHLLPRPHQVLLQQHLNPLETFNPLTILHAVPAIPPILRHQLKPPPPANDR